MSLSTIAWQKIKPIYQQIINHHFNQELAKGTLNMTIFAYYMEQDEYYLQANVQCDALITSKIGNQYIADFISYTNKSLIEEQNIDNFFAANPDLIRTNLTTQAAIGYSNYLLSNCAVNQVEIGVAVTLPCLWLYREVGIYVFNHMYDNNLYADWVESYTNDEYAQDVDNVIKIFDDLAINASDEVQEKMLEVFYNSAVWELRFYDDAYFMRSFDKLD